MRNTAVKNIEIQTGYVSGTQPRGLYGARSLNTEKTGAGK
jgi:hypothetical protein